MRIRVVIAAVLAVVPLATGRIDAQSGASPLKVLGSNGFRAVMEESMPRCEKAIGRHVTIEYGTSTSLLKRVASGEAFDVAVSTTEAMDDLVKSGKVNASTRTALGRSGIGIGVHAGSRKPDIKTVESLKRALVDAKSITFAGDGASRPHIEAMFEALGITKEMKAKTILEQGSVRAAAKVASGDAEQLITLISEILPAPGVEFVAPLPDRFQHYVSFAAAAGKSSADSETGRKLIGCLSGPEVVSTLKAKGMER